MATSGLVFGIDFAGGSTISVNMTKAFDKAQADAIVLKYAPDATTNKSATATETSGVMKELDIKSKDITIPFCLIKSTHSFFKIRLYG